jgi:hypothetical protein
MYSCECVQECERAVLSACIVLILVVCTRARALEWIYVKLRTCNCGAAHSQLHQVSQFDEEFNDDSEVFVKFGSL